MKKMSLGTQTLLGMVVGGIVGFAVGPKIVAIQFVGDIFLRMLQMAIVPLIYVSVTTAIANMGDIKRLGRIGIKVVLLFLATSISALAERGDSDYQAALKTNKLLVLKHARKSQNWGNVVIWYVIGTGDFRLPFARSYVHQRLKTLADEKTYPRNQTRTRRQRWVVAILASLISTLPCAKVQ